MNSFSFPLLPFLALGAVVGPRFSRDHIELLFAPVGLLRGPKWGSAVPIFFKLNRKFVSCIYIFNYACPIFKFNFNILKIIWCILVKNTMILHQKNKKKEFYSNMLRLKNLKAKLINFITKKIKIWIKIFIKPPKDSLIIIHIDCISLRLVLY